MTWEDIVWIRRLWKGPLILKGVMETEDAQRAVDVGADAIVVSNHGGRQLDGAPSSITMLPRIADAVGDKVEVLFDSGVRSGQDVLRAVALGARGVLMGRAYVYGLGAMGEAGVTRCLELINQELSLTMGFCGCTDIHDVGRDILFDAERG
jgi:L-lactate dehydrogenase (cytochrome)